MIKEIRQKNEINKFNERNINFINKVESGEYVLKNKYVSVETHERRKRNCCYNKLSKPKLNFNILFKDNSDGVNYIIKVNKIVYFNHPLFISLMDNKAEVILKLISKPQAEQLKSFMDKYQIENDFRSDKIPNYIKNINNYVERMEQIYLGLNDFGEYLKHISANGVLTISE